MGKGNGSTRASASSSPRGLVTAQQNVANALSANSARLGNRSTSAEYDKLHEQMGEDFALPVYEYQAREYREAYGEELPRDAVSIVFGRGAANGEDFYNVLSRPEYRNMRTIESRIDNDDTTFLTGYRDFDQLKAFIKDVKASGAVSRYNRLQRRWNHR